MARSHATRSQGSVPKLTPRDDSLRGRVEAVGPTHFGIVAVDCAQEFRAMAARRLLRDTRPHFRPETSGIEHRTTPLPSRPFVRRVVSISSATSSSSSNAPAAITCPSNARSPTPTSRSASSTPWPRINTARSNTPATRPTTSTLGARSTPPPSMASGSSPWPCRRCSSNSRDWARHRRDLVGKTSKLRLPDPRSSAQPHAGIRQKSSMISSRRNPDCSCRSISPSTPSAAAELRANWLKRLRAGRRPQPPEHARDHPGLGTQRPPRARAIPRSARSFSPI